MKALKILKERYKELSFFSETQRTPSNKLALILVEMVRLQEAIAELEALQEPKTCEGCKFDDGFQQCYRWDDCSREYTKKERIDRYVPKDTK